MSIPRDFIESLLAKIDLVDLINLRVPLQKKSGSNYFARCPFHQEKSGSFSVSQPKQFYYCFGCGAHGNAIDFLIEHDRLTFPEAVEALARQAGMEVPQDGTHTKKQDAIQPLYDLMVDTANFYYEQMRQSSRAIDYLKKRGISGNIAQQFQLGYAQAGWSHLVDKLGKQEPDKRKLLDTGLIIKKPEGGYYDRFRDRIIFPIHDYRGRIIGFGGRIIDQGEPKYLNSPETPLFQKGQELYGLYQALKANRQLQSIVIVEGYMDVIALFQHGIPYAVATMGTATSSHHFQRLFRYVSDIVFCFDGDEAGRTAAWRALQTLMPLMQDHIQARFLFLPEGEDPDSLVRQKGKAGFETQLANALSLADFFFQTLSRQCDMNTLEGRARFAAQALGTIKQISAGIFQGMLIEELSKRARMDVHELRQQVKRDAPIEKILPQTPAQPSKNKLPAPLRLAIALLIQHPDLVAQLASPLIENDLPGHAFLVQLVEMLKERPDMTTGMLLERWRDQKEEAFVAKMAQWEHLIPDEKIQTEFLSALRQVEVLYVEQEISRLLTQATHNGLEEKEKRALTEWMMKKKQLLESI